MSEKLMIYHPEYLEDFMDILKGKNLDLTFYPCKNKQDVLDGIADVDYILTCNTFPVDTLDIAESLKWIQLFTAGVENLVFSSHLPENVVVTRLTGTFGPRIAEYVLAHMLATTQKIPMALEQQKKKTWKFYLPDVLYTKTAGVIGLGSIGKEVARKASLLDMQVYGLTPKPKDLPFLKKCYGLAEINTFVADLDFLVLCLPLTPASKGLIDQKVISNMKPGAYIINISRGPIIVEKDLINALKNNTIAGAVLDVFDQEPLPLESELWALPQVRITPHMAGPSFVSECVDTFCHNYQNLKKGKPLINVIDRESGY